MTARPRRRRTVARLASLVILLALPACTSTTPGADGVATTPPTSSPAAATSASAEGATPTATDEVRTCPAAADLPLRQRLQQTVMVWSDGSGDLAAYVRNEDVLLGGVFVGGDATAGLEDGTYRALADRPVPLLVAVDDEGGQVQRLDAIAGDLPSAKEQAGEWSPARVRREAAQRARVMRDLGITVDLAPVVDLNDGTQGGVIGDRAYSADPEEATRYAEAFGRGLHDGGVLPTLKHFPGHGRATGDSHTTLPVTPPLASLEKQDLLPYERILGGDTDPWAVMVGHLVVPGLTGDDTPASLDPAAYAYLRDTLGFDGLVMTDELTGMQAVAADRTPEQAAAAALAAGADLLLLAAPGDLTALLDGLEERVRDGRLPEQRVTEAADHVLAVKDCPAG